MNRYQSDHPNQVHQLGGWIQERSATVGRNDNLTSLPSSFNRA